MFEILFWIPNFFKKLVKCVCVSGEIHRSAIKPKSAPDLGSLTHSGVPMSPAQEQPGLCPSRPAGDSQETNNNFLIKV